MCAMMISTVLAMPINAGNGDEGSDSGGMGSDTIPDKFILVGEDNGQILLYQFYPFAFWGVAADVTTMVPNGVPMGLDIFDSDNDNDLDFIVLVRSSTAPCSFTVYLFENTGTSFTNVWMSIIPRIPSTLDWTSLSDTTSSDFNNDNYIDFIVSIDWSGLTEYFRFSNDGTNSFTPLDSLPPAYIATWATHAAKMDSADFDGDGFGDFATFDYPLEADFQGKVAIYRGTGGFNFAPPIFASYKTPNSVATITAGQFDHDSNPDIIIGGDDDGDPGQHWIYSGDGNANLPDHPEAVFDLNLLHGYPSNDKRDGSPADSYDFDGDGKMDVVAASNPTLTDPGLPKVHFLRRTAPKDFQPPDEIAVLSFHVTAIAAPMTTSLGGGEAIPPTVKIWVPFIPGVEIGTPYIVQMKCSDNTGLAVDSSIPGMYVNNVPVEDEIYQRLEIPNAAHTTDIGKPQVPIIRSYLEIPYDINLSVEILYSSIIILDGYNVFPAQEFPYDTETAEEPDFVKDNTTYLTDAFYPSFNVSVEEPAIMRGHRIIALKLYPVQYNPVTKQLRAHSKIEVRVNYNQPAQIEGIEERLESQAFETLAESFILNYKPPDRYPTRRNNPHNSPAVDYLIISHDDFDTQVQPLADWKEKKGLRTEIEVTSNICTDPLVDDEDEITDYLQNAYDTWNPPPTYVLLVGDSEFIPTHYQTVHPSHGTMTATDLYYSTLDGTDHFPDIFVGRISVDTAAETTTIVNKILDYERNPPTDADFYDDISVLAHFQDRDDPGTPQDDRDGFEDRRFVLTSEEIRDYLLTQGYDVERIYNTDPGVTPTNYNNGIYDAGAPLPPALQPPFPWNGDTPDITNAFNAGRFIVNFRNHGSITGWGDPDFHNGDIPGLTNGDELPVVFSVTCQTGWFDGETDPYTGNTESFCEEILRYDSGGAVGIIGSTRDSPSGYNDALARGFYDAVWPDFDPTMTTGAMFELGQIHTYGKLLMALDTTFTSASMELLVYEEFHLFGDPEMSLWTQQPQALTVSHPSEIGSGGPQRFVVTVTDGTSPVSNAAVCLLKGTEIHTLEYTNPSGHAFFDITPTTGGNMDITVTRHNYRPYEGVIAVTSSGATITVSPDIGPPGITFTITGSNFDNGETVDIVFGGTYLGWTTASGGAFSASFTVPSVPEGPTNVVATGQSSGRVAVALFRVLPAVPLPDPYTYCQWDSSTWHLAADGAQHWDSPSIQLYEGAVAVSSYDLIVGTTYTIEADIYNAGPGDAVGTVVTFKSSFWAAGQNIWHDIGTDTIDVPGFGGPVVASVEWTPIVPGFGCLIVEVYHPWDTDLGNNKGQENTRVSPITSPGEFLFTVENPTNQTGLPYIEVTQTGVGNESLEDWQLWGTRVDRDFPQILRPGENQTARLTVNAPDYARIGDTRVISVTVSINGELIGGVELTVVKNNPPDLIDPKVTPDPVNPGDIVTFTVTYRDVNEHPPVVGHPKLSLFKGGVPVNGSPFTMNELDLNDTSYKDGKIYTCTVTLFEVGDDYTHFFYASDGLTGPVRTKTFHGPTVGEFGKEWIQFTPGAEPGAPPIVQMKCSDTTGLVVDSDIPGMYVTNVSVDGEIYQKLDIPYAGQTIEIGKPEVPEIRKYLEIPYDVNLSVEILYTGIIILDGYNVFPAQEPLSDNQSNWTFVIDNETYSKDAFYPANNVIIEDPVIMRGHRISPLIINPVQYNPVTKQLRAYSKIEVRINYHHPSQILGIEERLESPAFEILGKAYILNYKLPERYVLRRYFPWLKGPSVDYLIITPEKFLNQVKPLADWKQKKGLRVLTVTTATTGTTASDIQDYIQDAYDNWLPPPTYVLLFGDVGDIPTSAAGTDLYYFTVDGPDYLPDIFGGRIPVQTTEEARIVVDKIINYEKNPPTGTNWFDNVLLAASDEPRGSAGQPVWIQTSDTIDNYLTGEGYTCTKVYYDYPSDPNSAQLTQDIISSFNNGILIANHRDHGSPNGWSHPSFRINHIPSLTNGQELPVMFSMNCLSGRFDQTADCFGEALLKANNSGVVGFIGATRISYTFYNDQMDLGFYDAIWPDFVAPTQNSLYSLAEVLLYGKIHMLMTHGSGYTDSTTEKEFEIFHLLGDPEMPIWTRQPQSLTVNHPSTIGSRNYQNFVVKVTDGTDPVTHARVCLYKSGVVSHTIGYTDAAGNVIFNVRPYSSGSIDITVTKQDFLPYEGSIAVTANGAAITELLPSSGVPGQPFRIKGKDFSNGETVRFYFDTTYLGSTPASSGNIDDIQSVPSPYSVGPANVIATGQTSGRTGVSVFTVFPPSPLPDPYIYSQWDPSTWHLNPGSGNPVWNNPEIKIYDGTTLVNSGNLRVGTSYRIDATIHNSGSVAASGTQVDFKWAKIGMGQRLWNLLGTDNVNIPSSPGSATASVFWTPTLAGHCCIKVEIYHPSDSDLDNNKGQENCQVNHGSSPAVITFDVTNPTDAPALVYLEVTQINDMENIWGTKCSREYPQILNPLETQTATLVVNVPDDATIGETRIFTVTGSIKGDIIGGIDFNVVKDHPPILTGGTVDPPGGGPGTVYLFTVTYIDEDNHAPLLGFPQLYLFKGDIQINGSPFDMYELDPSDDDYTDGKIYRCSVILPEAGDDYSYYFWAWDSLGIGAEGPSVEITDGPITLDVHCSEYTGPPNPLLETTIELTPDVVYPGQDVEIGITVKNIGDEATLLWNMEPVCAWAHIMKWDPGPVEVDYVASQHDSHLMVLYYLDPDEEWTGTLTWHVPTDIEIGVYTVSAHAGYSPYGHADVEVIPFPCAEEYALVGEYDGDIWLFPWIGTTFGPKILVADFNGPVLGLDIFDFENDDDLDFIALIKTPPINDLWHFDAYLFLNDGCCNFNIVPITNSLPTFQGDWGTSKSDSTAADFNNDGYTDFVVSISGNNTVTRIYRFHNNNGDTIDPFSQIDPYLEATWATHAKDMDSGDFDEDGNWDFLIFDYPHGADFQEAVYLYQGNGDFTFNLNYIFQTEHSVNTITAGDFDNDYNYDTIIGGDDDGDPGQYWLYQGNGDKTFDPPLEVFDKGPAESGYDQLGAGYVDSYDFDKDGNLDVVGTKTYDSITPQGRPCTFFYIRGNGDSTFQPEDDIDSDLLYCTAVAAPPLKLILTTCVDANGPYGTQDDPLYECNTIVFHADKVNPEPGIWYLFRWDFNDDGVWDTPWHPGTTATSDDYQYHYCDDYYGKVVVQAWDGISASMETIQKKVLGEADPTTSMVPTPMIKTVGWRFEVFKDCWVKELGYYDSLSQYYVYNLRLWTDNGVLLRQVWYPWGIPDQWNWYDIPDVPLLAGRYYRVSISYYGRECPAVENPGPNHCVEPTGAYYFWSISFPSIYIGDSPLPMVDIHIGWNETLLEICEDTADVWVTNRPPIVGEIAMTPNPAYEGEEVEFTASFIDPGTCDTWEYRWIFGDGTATEWYPIQKYAGGADILILHTWTDIIDDFKVTLEENSPPCCRIIDDYDFGPFGNDAAPTLALLLNYDVVIVGTNYAPSMSVAEDVGDVLADYMDFGGNVITMCAALDNGPFGIKGRFKDDQYNAVEFSSLNFGWADKGTIYEVDHPILEGVSNVRAFYRYNAISVTPGAIRIVDWTDGTVLAAVKEFPNDARSCALQFYPIATHVDDDWVELIANAIVWTSGQPPPNPLDMPIQLDPITHIYADDHPETMTPWDIFQVEVQVRDDDHNRNVPCETIICETDFPSEEWPPCWSGSGGWRLDPDSTGGYWAITNSTGILSSIHFDLTDLNEQIILEFETEWENWGFGIQNGYIEASSDGGSNWNLIWEMPPSDFTDMMTFDVSFLGGHSDVCLRFRAVIENGGTWAIDNIKFYQLKINIINGLGSATEELTIYNEFPAAVGQSSDTARVDEPHDFEGYKVSDPAMCQPTEWFAYRWDFGDGTITDWDYLGSCNEDIPTISHVWNETGLYYVDLQIIDDDMYWYWDFATGEPVYVGPPGEEENWISHNFILIQVT